MVTNKPLQTQGILLTLGKFFPYTRHNTITVLVYTKKEKKSPQ